MEKRRSRKFRRHSAICGSTALRILAEQLLLRLNSYCWEGIFETKTRPA